ncbi:MAG: sulfatase [Porphyromonadaceae bacterium]|nr:sulfatase [Porphyromonadaceae bacterium]
MMKADIRYTVIFIPLIPFTGCKGKVEAKPNILFVIADDQSFPHASAYGNTMISTPGFDFVASQGALFTNAYVTSPGSSPSRASILTGLYPWQLENAGTHASSFPASYVCFPDILQKNGYQIGYTGKGWGPGNWKVSGRPYNPAGHEYNDEKLTPPYDGISKIDYAANFRKFLGKRKKKQPFYFWLGAHEPHRPFEKESWKAEGYVLEKAKMVGFLPENDSIKSDLLDYAVEIEWFDSQLQQCIEELKRIGEFENTIIIVTADNGMAFPRAKANCYDAGIHVPLAICWQNKIKQSRIIETLVSTVDFAPTIIEAANLKSDVPYSGKSLMPLLTSGTKNYENTIFAGRERHSFARYNNEGYPVRCIRWKNYLLIRNFHPERWPAGDPQELIGNSEIRKPDNGYFDIDASPSKEFLVNHQNEKEVASFFRAAVDKRHEYELFDLKNDPDCMADLIENSSYTDVIMEMKNLLTNKLIATQDPRLGENPEIWETYPRLEGKMRNFPVTE